MGRNLKTRSKSRRQRKRKSRKYSFRHTKRGGRTRRRHKKIMRGGKRTRRRRKSGMRGGMILPRRSAANAAPAGGGTILLDDDKRTLASYGITGSEEYDDIVPLEMVVVAPLTPEQLEARRKEVYLAVEAVSYPGGGDCGLRLQKAIQAAKDRGADLNWRNRNYQQTPVWIAAAGGRDGCLSQLIAAGADVNIPSDWGKTPVWIAASNGRDGCVAQLIAAGADVNIKDNFYGWTPLQAARERSAQTSGGRRAAVLLRDAGAN